VVFITVVNSEVILCQHKHDIAGKKAFCSAKSTIIIVHLVEQYNGHKSWNKFTKQQINDLLIHIATHTQA